MKKIIYHLCTKFAACALFMAVTSTNMASCFGLYQPKIPDELIK